MASNYLLCIIRTYMKPSQHVAKPVRIKGNQNIQYNYKVPDQHYGVAIYTYVYRMHVI